MTGILRILYTAFTIVFLATTLQANSTIVPVIVDVKASGRGVVEITNLRTQPTLYNIEVLKWAVVDGADEYEDTRLFIVSPPSFKLHPGKSKKVRLGFRRPIAVASIKQVRSALTQNSRNQAASPIINCDSATAPLPLLDIIPVAVCWAARMAHFSRHQNWDSNLQW